MLCITRVPGTLSSQSGLGRKLSAKVPNSAGSVTVTPKSLRQNSFISVSMSCAQHNPPTEKALFHRQIPGFGALGPCPRARAGGRIRVGANSSDCRPTFYAALGGRRWTETRPEHCQGFLQALGLWMVFIPFIVVSCIFFTRGPYRTFITRRKQVGFVIF